MKNENRGRDIFFGVVAVATLIVAIVGATLAYFSITASSNEGAINATAAIVSIEYNDGQQVTAQADQLIPADLDVVQKVYETKVKDSNVQVDEEGNPLDESELKEQIGNMCIDSNNFQVCSAYRFTIKSEIERTITATLNNEENGFTYLSYAVYNVTKGEWMSLTDENDYSLPLTTCSNLNNEGSNANTEDECFVTTGTKKAYEDRAINSIFGLTLDGAETVKKTEKVSGVTQVYDLVLFIQNADFDQNVDQGKSYRGTIIVDVLDGGIAGNGQISGYVDPNE